MADKYINEIPERQELIQKYGLRDIRFVKNLKDHPVRRNKMRGNANAFFDFRDMYVLNAHISELVPGGNSNKHRHSNEAIILILAGKGYSILQKEEEPEQRIDWSEGDLMAVPAYYWHQHFNVDANNTARYLAVKNVPLIEKIGLFVVEQARMK